MCLIFTLYHKFQKAHARLCALKKSTSINDETKEKIAPLLTADYMSSEESAYVDSSNSEDDEAEQRRKKRLIRHPLPWRSAEFWRLLESLDRKIDQRRTDRSRSMCLDVEVGTESTRQAPHDIPDWAKELFS